MAHLDATQWNNLQESRAFDETRFSPLGINDAVADSTPFTGDYISPEARNILQTISGSRELEIPQVVQGVATTTTTPTFDIPPNLLETQQFNYTAVNIASGFRLYPAAFENNSVGLEYYRDRAMMRVAYALGNAIESTLASQLEARKTQNLGFLNEISQGDGTFVFNAVSDELEIQKAAQRETMFFKTKVLFEANEFPGELRIVTNRGGLAEQRSQRAQRGEANDRNLQALGFFPEERIYETGNITTQGNRPMQGWVFRDGAIGMIENFPVDFRQGTEVGTRRWSVSDVPIPFCRMRANILTNSAATEAESVVAPSGGRPNDSNLTLTKFEEMLVWIRFYVVYMPNTLLASRPNDIIKITGLDT